MKYKVRVSELRYGEVEVDASSEREAKNKALRVGFNFFDSEVTDMTAEKVALNGPASVIEHLERWAKGDTCDDCPARDDTVFQAAELLRKAYLDETGRRTYVVTELCSNCEQEVEIHGWDTERDGYKAFCPYCGEVLMLCDECQHSEQRQPCDFDANTDLCRYRRKDVPEAEQLC